MDGRQPEVIHLDVSRHIGNWPVRGRSSETEGVLLSVHGNAVLARMLKAAPVRGLPHCRPVLLRVLLRDGEAAADAECLGGDLQARRGLLPFVLVAVHFVHDVHHGFER